MIVWMLQSLLAAAMIAGAAVAIEEGARVGRRPLRWGWLAAMVAAAVLPPLFRLLPAAPAAESAGGVLDPQLLEALLSASTSVERPATLLDRLLSGGEADALLLAAWAVIASAMAGALLLTHRRLRRVRAAGHPVEIAGLPALLTHSTGPMVVGVRRPEVVVPRWIDELTDAEQRLVLRHEWEHVRAGDTRLLLAGAVLVAAMPWNLPLWWMRSRLRQAIEVDCDARVLAAGVDRRLYGGMLIRTAGRPRPAPLLAPALVELPSLLERRILAMTQRTPAHRNLRLGTAALLTVMLVAAACELTPRSTAPSPTEPTLAEVLDGEEGAVVVEKAAVGQTVPLEAVVLTSDGSGQAVVTANGDTLRATSVRIRTTGGTFSTGSAKPLVLVDGQRVTSLEEVDRKRIVSIQILKDAAATDAYGPEGVDGVILVTTGEPGPTRVRSPRPAEAPTVVEEGVVVAPARAPRAGARAQTLEGVVAIGYGAQRQASAAVAPSATVVEEVVAVGYGAQTREGMAAAQAPGAIRIRGALTKAEPVAPAAVVVEGAAHAPTASAAPAVAVRPGAVVPAPASEPQPLILVDGEQVRSFAELAERFAPGQIASINVIKDTEAAVAQYGARARHGAVIVTLKK